MLFFLKYLSPLWGPMRIFGSYLVLLCASGLAAAFFVQRRLPRLFGRMPCDRGKTVTTTTGAVIDTPDAGASRGKPTGAGRWLLFLLLPLFFFFLPPSLPGVDKTTALADVIAILKDVLSSPGKWHYLLNPQWAAVGCLFLAMFTGYADDRAVNPWSRLKKGLWDAVIAVAAAAIIYYLGEEQCHTIWIPLTKKGFEIPVWIYIPMAAMLLWLSMNAANCTDGVDGLVSSLSLTTLFIAAAFLYGVVGHREIAEYLLVPHNPEGARWGILCAIVAGGYAGYLWHNAYPSAVLMGDAGSRPLGLLVGIATLASGNPLLIIAISPIVCVNGLGGLVKITLLMGLRKCGVNIADPNRNEGRDNPHPTWIVRALFRYRFPLHDHCRKALKWSPTQVVIRFMLLQAFFVPILLLLFLKVR